MHQVVIPEEVVVQPRLTVSVLVLQPEWLVHRSRHVRLALQFTQAVIIPEPNQISFTISHLTREADLVAVEVAGLVFEVV